MLASPEKDRKFLQSIATINRTIDVLTPPSNPELWGNPDYNFLLQKEIKLSKRAIKYTRALGLHPYLTVGTQILENGGLLDRTWLNCFRHNLIACELNMAQAATEGRPADIVLEEGLTGLVHDASQRINKENMRSSGSSQNGQYVTRNVSPEELFAAEWNERPVEGVEGLDCIKTHILTPTRVTHLDWRGYLRKEWTDEDERIRITDCAVAAPRNPDGAYGRDQIVDPFYRINMLKTYKHELDEEGKKPQYYGMPTFDVLASITGEIIPKRTESAFNANPEFMDSYYQGDYVGLMGKIVHRKVPLPLPPMKYPLM